MSQRNEFHGGHRLHPNYMSSISTGVSDTRSFGSNSGAVRPQQQQFHLPQPIEVNFRNYPPPVPSTASTWDGTLPNYGYPDTSLFRSNQEHIEARGPENPLLNWYTNNDGPWIPRGTVPEAPMDHSHSRGQTLGFRSTGTTTPFEPNTPREANTSESGGVPFVYLASDSGYGTRRSFGNVSVLSSEVLDRSQDCSSLTSQGNDNQSFPTLKVPDLTNEPESSESWAGSQPASTGNPSRSELLRCPGCGKDVKTKSELKKHDLRHKKPFHCKHPGCTYKKGFSTTNDLERHTKSKHPSDSCRTSSKVYRCAQPQCKSQTKEWPRLDNFRCHIKRVHQLEGEALEAVVRRSEYHTSLETSEHYDRTRSSGRMNQNDSRDLRYQDRDMQQQQFLQGLTIVDKVSQEPHSSEDSDNAVSDVFDGSRVLEKGGVSRLHDPMDFRSKGFGSTEIGPLSERSFIHNRLEVQSIPRSVEADHYVSVKQRHSPISDSEQQDYQKESRLSSQLQESDGADPASFKFSDFLNNIKPILERQLEHSRSASALVDKNSGLDDSKDFRPQSSFNKILPSPKQDITISSQDVQQMREVIKMIETLGHRFQGDSCSEESKEPHSKKYPTPDPSEASTVPHPGVKAEPSVCKICFKFKGLPCQMKKHMKRHEKPYGCTFMNCGKVFGSKNDWKRHENSQHFQSETWRCDEEKPTRFLSTSSSKHPPCAKVFYRKESYKDHLTKEHRVCDESVLKQKLETCRIGRNCQSRFWCGFCKELKVLKKRGVEAWTERFNHIDDHFEGRKGLKKQNIKEWLPIDGEELPEQQREQASPDVVSLLDDEESDAPSSFSQAVDDVGRLQPTNGNVTFDPVEWNPPGTRKRQNDAGENGRPAKSARRSRPERRIECCQCESLHNPDVVVGCTFCDNNHRFCVNCSVVEADPCPRGSDA